MELDSLGKSMFNMKQILLQAGYLTVAETKRGDFGKLMIKLGSPNMEVKEAIQSQVFKTVFKSRVNTKVVSQLEQSFNEGDVDGFVKAANSALATIPYNVLKKSTKLGEKTVMGIEGFWASAMIMLVHPLSFSSTPHVLTSTGEIDMEFEDEDQIWIIDWKVVQKKKEGKKQQKFTANQKTEGNPILFLFFSFLNIFE